MNNTEKRTFGEVSDNKKEVVIYDYVDLDVPVLARMYGRRIKGYHSIGYEIEDK